MKIGTSNFSEIPEGLYLFVAEFEGLPGRRLSQIALKLGDAPWHSQPACVPSTGCDFDKPSPIHRPFVDWAKQNLPIYFHPTIIPRC